jgi:UDP-2,3-diacylglucosamine hydrolase
VGGAGPAVAASFVCFEAPPAWRRIDFVSDLHLSAALPRTFAAFAAHLQHTPADAVFILGDLFELWVGDDLRARDFERRCVEVMADASRRLHLAFMHGNRDFLVGEALGRDAGLSLLPDPTLLAAFDRRIVLSHGDALCLADTAYQAFRTDVRSAEWQGRFLARPLAERIAIAEGIRQASRDNQARKRFDGEAWADVDAGAALQWLDAAGARVLVHGHTHRPASAPLTPGRADGPVRHVLSDWDLDGAHGAGPPRAEVLVLTPAGFSRQPPATAG